ncbi:MAG TPA: serine/threonine-protein kinase [Polyangia bacterium]
MGVVYKGVDLESSGAARAVAVKFLHDALAGVPDLVKRFRREVEVMRRLTHPNLVGVLDSGVSAGVPYLVMDFQAGRSLTEVLERGALPPPRAIALARQVLAGVAHAHGQGVLHRDLKPDNILLIPTDDGGEQVKILDFGLAKLLDDEGTQLTNTGFALGTPAYMAPEQAKGQPTSERTDLYSVGVVLYHMVVGRRPFVAESPMAVLRMHMDDAPVAPRKAAPDQKLSAALDAAIVRALAKDPRDRFTSAEEMARTLAATPEGQSRASKRRLGSRAGRKMGALVAIGLAGAGGLFAWSQLTRVQKQRVRRTVSDVQHRIEVPVKQQLEGAADATRDALRALRSPTPAKANDDDGDDDSGPDPHASDRTPGAELEAASHPSAHAHGHAARPARLKDATRLIANGKIDDAIQVLYRLREQTPHSAEVALWLGHAYFRKMWRTDGLREYDGALALRPSLKTDRELQRDAVAALDDPTARPARALIRKRLGTSALAELRRAARTAKNPKVQKRAARLAAQLTPARRKKHR